MYPKTLFGNYVTLYGVCIALGIVACIVVLRFLGKRRNIDKKFLDFVELNAYIAIAVGFFTSWIFQVFYNFIETGEWKFDSGITFLGGLIGGIASFLIVYIIMKKAGKLTGTVTQILPIAAPCITIAHGFGRIGCFFSGCCHGITPQEGSPFSFLAINFPIYSEKTVNTFFGTTVSIPEEIIGYVKYYPTQLWEALFLLAITAVFILLIYFKDFKFSLPTYLASYGVWRFLVEFVRGDDRGQIIPGYDFPSPSQFFGIIMALAAIPVFFLVRYLYNLKKKNSNILVDPTADIDNIDSSTESNNEESNQ